MNKLSHQINKAKKSSFQLWLLNFVLLRTVPFNKPHNLRLISISESNELTIEVKNRRNNLNHIKGIHACLLATLCEYISGLSLLIKLDPTRYRIILKSIKMDYHYQAKSPVFSQFALDNTIVENNILTPLQATDAVLKTFEVKVWDKNKNHICTGHIEWQIKGWNNVKTKL